MRSEARTTAKDLRDIATIGIVNHRRDTAALYAAANLLEKQEDRIEAQEKELEDLRERLAIVMEGETDAGGDDGSDFDPDKYEYRDEMRF